MLCVQGNARLGEIGHPQLLDGRGGNVVDRRARHVCFMYASSGCKAGRRDVGVAHGQPCRGRGGMRYIDSVRSREFVFDLFDYKEYRIPGRECTTRQLARCVHLDCYKRICEQRMCGMSSPHLTSLLANTSRPGARVLL